MRGLTKVILIIAVFLMSGLIITLIKGATGNQTGTGPFGFIIIIGMVAAIRAIWKYKPESEQKKDTSADNQTLDKR